MRRVRVGELGGVVRERHGVEVDDAVERLVGRRRLVLGGDPVPHRAQVVAEVDLTGRLDAREAHAPRRRDDYRPVRRPVRDAVRPGRRSGTLDSRCRTRSAPPSSRARSTCCCTSSSRRRSSCGRCRSSTIVDAYLAELDRMDDGARPRRRHRVPAHRGHARRAQGPPPAPRPRRRRARRGAAPLRGARPAARPPARVQDVQGRRRRVRGPHPPRRPQRAARRRARGAVPLARARPARARRGPTRCAPRRCACSRRKPVPVVDTDHIAPVRASVARRGRDRAAPAARVGADELPRPGRRRARTGSSSSCASSRCSSSTSRASSTSCSSRTSASCVVRRLRTGESVARRRPASTTGTTRRSADVARVDDVRRPP